MLNDVDDIDRALFVDINTILPDDYQVKMDRFYVKFAGSKGAIP